MNPNIIRPLAILLVLVSSSVYAQTGTDSTLDKRVRSEVAQFKGKVSLFAKNLDTGAVYTLGGDEPGADGEHNQSRRHG